MKELLNRVYSWKKRIQRLLLPTVMVTLASFVFAASAWATGVYDMPTIKSGESTWVVDQADVISRLSEGKLNSTLENLAKQTGKEVRFVTVRRLDYGETPESFTKALFEKWFPAKEAQANQIILMIDVAKNGTAIITGDKVKSLMPDDIALSVASETLTVPLRDGDKYNQAFIDAGDRLVAVLSGEADPGPPQVTDNVAVESTFATAEDTDTNKGNATAWVIGLLVAATVIPMATYYIYQVFQPSSNG
ncbi:MAG: TPM domain-containing protein [Brasilonema octagenarum HA4186-MV1]|jgi:uncharacterized protein|uniref:YgcG family protein n=2 Tax=Brasilonema TaxID=383614 RepID=A0A856MI32_9CYAN|nr:MULTISPECIES: TPM domain-containing protein [Brasilonema]MBW4629768.1 TPM domain-containing protein [Brasilonema octagenarum HA4186-MV1]NMF66812.1 YgcG family protein [Brasilonema octagenarum UFV-OR1]QDL11015.1 YgcG family protein [Brasilonema sennae CENA114]QDL17360.1 YgcG family protein [Brasilonema octagenarum UFV-E1]